MAGPTGENREDDDGSTEDEREAPPRASKPKKKKKRSRKASAADTAAVVLEPVRSSSAPERPAFLLEFPEDPELAKLSAAFESGDYATVRAGALVLSEKSKKRSVRDAALELRRRTDADPLMKYLLLASIVLLVFLTLHSYFQRGH